jgi:HicB_like antitoxin of bacterial toxin-antitoxin system
VSSAGHYPKQLFRDEEDEGFIAIAPDLPGCSAFGETEQEALSELDDAIIAWISACGAGCRDCAGHRRVNQHLKGPTSGKAANSDPI